MFQNVSHSFSFVPCMKHIFLFLNVSDCFRTNHFPETKKNGNSEIISFHSFLPKPDREGFICLAFLQLQHSESVLHWHVPVQSEGRQNLRIYPSLLSDYAMETPPWNASRCSRTESPSTTVKTSARCPWSRSDTRTCPAALRSQKSVRTAA